MQVEADLFGGLSVARMLLVEAHAENLQVLQYAGQGVVDLVGDAGGQVADGEHLFRLQHHLFQFLAPADVTDGGDDHLAAVDGRRSQADLDPEEFTVETAGVPFENPVSLEQGGGDVQADSLPVERRCSQAEFFDIAGQQFVPAGAVHGLGGFVGIEDDAGGGVVNEKSVVGGVEDLPEAAFTLGQPPGGFFLLGDVTDDADQNRFAVGREHQALAGGQDAGTASGGRDPLDVQVGFAGIEDLVVFLPEHPRLIFRKEIEVRLAEQLVTWAPDQFAKGVIEADPAMVPVLGENGIGNGIEQFVEENLHRHPVADIDQNAAQAGCLFTVDNRAGIADDMADAAIGQSHAVDAIVPVHRAGLEQGMDAPLHDGTIFR